MRRSLAISTTLFLVAAVAALGQESGTRAPIAGNPKVELKGRIEKVLVARGQGMPTLEISAWGKAVSVQLGSMRYLMEQGFNPKAGEDVGVTGYQVNESVVAITVTLPATGKVLRLRDENGWPLWAGGRRGGPPREPPK